LPFSPEHPNIAVKARRTTTTLLRAPISFTEGL
jgi:hypothetical protein